MPLSPTVLKKRAVNAGVKASKKRHHLITEAELLALRVQVLPASMRVFLSLCGLLLLAACWHRWPSDSNPVQALEAVAGILLIAFGAFGVRRTISKIVDSVDVIDFTSDVIGLVGDALSQIDH